MDEIQNFHACVPVTNCRSEILLLYYSLLCSDVIKTSIETKKDFIMATADFSVKMAAATI